MSPIRAAAAPAILAIFFAACNKSPAAPSVTGNGVTINGTVTAPVPSGLRVEVGGSGNSAPVDGSGQFTLSNAPSGTIDLRFTGGASASLVLLNLLADQTVTLVVAVNGPSATLESARRVRGTDEEVEGRVQSVSPPDTFVVAGRTVSTSSGTNLTSGTQTVPFDRLAVGQRVTAKGQTGGGALIATSVDILTTIPVENLNVSGAISNFTGTRSAFQFVTAGIQIRGDDATLFSSSQFNELGDGLIVSIAAAERPGFLYATGLSIASPATSFTGRVLSKSGTPPQLVLAVGGQAVMLTTQTAVLRKGDPQNASTIAHLQTVRVNGRILPNGWVLAGILDILMDSAGGVFSMTGTIGAISGTCPQSQLTVAGYTINTAASTTFPTAPCDALAAGDRVEVQGVVQPDFTVTANSIKKV